MLNSDKSKLLITNLSEDISINVGKEYIKSRASVKLLGLKIESNLTFNEHVSDICKKAIQKLHDLARISKYMNRNKLCRLCKSFIESQFVYCPLIWMFHNRTLNSKINRLNEKTNERTLRIVYGNQNLTLTDLSTSDNSVMINNRNLQKLATEMYKAKNNLSPFYRVQNTLQFTEQPIFLCKYIYVQFYVVQNRSHSGVQKCGTWFPMKSRIQRLTRL